MTMAVSAAANRRVTRTATSPRRSGLVFAVVAGLLMGFFYPELMRSISPGFNTEPVRTGYLTPYTALLFFGCGVVVSSLPFKGWFMRTRHSRLTDS